MNIFGNPGPLDKELFKPFRDMFGNPVVSPIGEVKQDDGFHSHFTFIKPTNIDARDPGWHVTTDMRGIGPIDHTFLGQ